MARSIPSRLKCGDLSMVVRTAIRSSLIASHEAGIRLGKDYDASGHLTRVT